jgi:prepilin-type processing-associated H-X9-DG protein
VFLKQNDYSLANPAKVLNFLDVAPGFVCYPAFEIVLEANLFYHMPSAAHDEGSPMTFADGHAEYRRLVEPVTIKDATQTKWVDNHLQYWRSNNRDLKWIQERASVKNSP